MKTNYMIMFLSIAMMGLVIVMAVDMRNKHVAYEKHKNEIQILLNTPSIDADPVSPVDLIQSSSSNRENLTQEEKDLVAKIEEVRTQNSSMTSSNNSKYVLSSKEQNFIRKIEAQRNGGQADDTTSDIYDEIDPPQYADKLDYLSHSSTYISVDDNDAGLLARLIESEAGVEPYNAKIGVGNVVLNRARYDNKSIREVIFAPHQFDGVNTDNFTRDPSADSVMAAIEVLKGTAILPSTAYFFADLNLCSPDWATQSRFIMRIGDTWFFNY